MLPERTTNQSGLRLVNLGIIAGSNTLLENFNTTLAPGESKAIIAPSGFGKTTLLRTIAGLIPPKSGQIFWNDKTPDDIGFPQYRRQIVWVSQNPVMFEKSVRENLRTAFSYHSSHLIFDERAALTLLENMGMSASYFEQNARSLSVGEQQRVALARALLIQPAVLLLDEPTSALDADTVTRVETVVKNVTAKNRTALLVVTHNREQAARLCDSVIDLLDFKKGSHGIF